MIVRTAVTTDSKAIADIHVASWQSTYRGQMPEELLNNLSVAEREARWRDDIEKGASVLLAEQDAKALGFVCFGQSRDKDKDPARTGEVFAIYLYGEAQGCGVGRGLWEAATRELARDGACEVTVWALETNHLARGFYERMGCALDGMSKAISIGGADLREVRYGGGLSR